MEKINLQKKITKVIFLLAICSLPLAVCYADVPHLINYQGRLTDSNGKPVEDNKTFEVTFTIFNTQSGQSQSMAPWQETQTITAQNGLFSAQIGATKDLDLPFDEQYWLEIKVNNEILGPRQKIASSAYALRAQTADSLPNSVILMSKTVCPRGYKRIGALDGKFLVGGSSYNPVAGGTNTHAHNYSGTTNENSQNKCQDVGHECAHSSPVDAHSHYYSGATSPVDSRPEYATVVLCEKE